MKRMQEHFRNNSELPFEGAVFQLCVVFKVSAEADEWDDLKSLFTWSNLWCFVIQWHYSWSNYIYYSESFSFELSLQVTIYTLQHKSFWCDIVYCVGKIPTKFLPLQDSFMWCHWHQRRKEVPLSFSYYAPWIMHQITKAWVSTSTFISMEEYRLSHGAKVWWGGWSVTSLWNQVKYMVLAFIYIICGCIVYIGCNIKGTTWGGQKGSRWGGEYFTHKQTSFGGIRCTVVIS